MCIDSILYRNQKIVLNYNHSFQDGEQLEDAPIEVVPLKENLAYLKAAWEPIHVCLFKAKRRIKNGYYYAVFFFHGSIGWNRFSAKF